MLRTGNSMPKVILGISAFGVVLLLFALTTGRESSWALPIPSSSSSSSGSSSAQQDARQAYLDEKLRLADKLWTQSVKDREVMAKRMGTDRKFPDDYINPYHVWDFARPSFFCPHDFERVGRLGDGGKVVCGMSVYEQKSPGPASLANPAPELVVYSFGVNKDSSFEGAMLERTNARIWGYDYSVEAWAKEVPEEHRGTLAHFSKYGIGITDPSHDPPFYSIQDLMAMNGHDYIDIVKLDIEGAEFDAMRTLIDHVVRENGEGAPLPIGQLLIEIHFYVDPKKDFLHSPKDLKEWMEWFHSMEKHGLRPVNNECNWIGNNRFGKPRFIEYTMINAMDPEKNKLLTVQ